MKKHGEAGHIVNTASIAGLQVNPKLRNGSYAMTKYAVVAASEALAFNLEGSATSASPCCARRWSQPRSMHPRNAGRSGSAARLRSRTPKRPGPHCSQQACRPTTSAVACSTRSRQSEFFIFTHEEPRAWIEARHQRLMDGFDSIERYNARERGSVADASTLYPLPLPRALRGRGAGGEGRSFAACSAGDSHPRSFARYARDLSPHAGRGEEPSRLERAPNSPTRKLHQPRILGADRRKNLRQILLDPLLRTGDTDREPPVARRRRHHQPDHADAARHHAARQAIAVVAHLFDARCASD